jgi:hypothetical protein
MFPLKAVRSLTGGPIETLFLILYVRRTQTAQTDGQMTADVQAAQEAEGQTGGWDSDRVGRTNRRAGWQSLECQLASESYPGLAGPGGQLHYLSC